MSILELIAVIVYVAILISVLLIVFFRCEGENRKLLSSIFFLLFMIVIIIIVNIPVFQFLLFLLVVLDLIYISYVHILPFFYSESDKILFVEQTKEVWDEIKVNEALIQEKQSKK